MRLDNLKILESFLQNSLHAHLAGIVPFRIQCVYKNDTLLVLAQHAANIEIDVPDTFKVLEQALQAEEPKTPLAVKLYLRTEGDRRPYSQKSFRVYPHVKKVVSGEAAPELTDYSQDRASLRIDSPPIAAMKSTPTPSAIDNSTIPQSEVILGEIVSTDAAENSPQNSPQSALAKLESDRFSANLAPSANEMPIDPPPARRSSKPQRKILVPILGVLGFIAVGSGAGYMGTRPCVFGACTELNNATQVAESSFATANNPRSTGNDILVAQQKLRQSIDTLESIPLWSGSHDTAQTALQATKPPAQDLDIAVGAMNQAWAATNIVKSLPISVAKWQESKRMWVESIASLGKVPTTSKVYPLAQQKLTNYRSKLGEIENRIGAENAADEALKLAISESQLATQAQSVAKTLPEWQKVKAMWDRVNTKLTSIPSTTIAYPQAQSILTTDRPQIATATEKVREEEKANQEYNTAVKFATEAKLADKNNRPLIAVNRWNQAVVAIQNIPETSTVYDRAKPLVFEYTKSFQRAEEQLKINERIALSTKDLQSTCAGSPQICTYTVTNKGIVVRFTPLYSNTVMDRAKTAVAGDNGTAKMGILSHVNTLGDALQTISENAQLPIAVYGADGKQIQNYKPQR
jgi:hypothetical protein